MLNIGFYGRRNFKECHISIKVNLFNTVFIKFYVPLVVVLPRRFARSRDNFRKFWELLCDCSFDRLSFSMEIHWGYVCLMFMACWFNVTIKLMVDMGNLTTLIYCFDLVIRCEVGGWWLRILVSCFNVSMFIIWFRVRGVYNLLFQDLSSPSCLLFRNKHWSLVIYLMLPLHYDSGLNIFSLNSCWLRKLLLLLECC